ncbi:hypothetical protein Cgig2_017906 [Carnegiea gigantea]|uniref:Uncharacterized protein n=1 Tax=Carnegiea gigantea TaxID=171969 RepID=A0A9Q1K724_9CARY|nr:hypothetical protein Cgig2_017906 [Carnegiea gigantea]
MVKFRGLGRAKSFQLEEARELISFTKGFRWHSSIINCFKETLTDDNKLSRIDFAYFMSIRSIDNLASTRMFLLTRTLIIFLIRNNASLSPRAHTLWNKVSSITSWAMHFTWDKNHSCISIPKDEGIYGSKPKLKIVQTGKPLEHFVPLTEDDSSRVKIPGIDVVIPTTPIPAILI